MKTSIHLERDETLVQQFKSPSAQYRPMPLWVWNGDVTESRIVEMLDQFNANGIGGVFIHPRPGLITEYLSERWFELWAFALRECEKRGLECHIYDENSFPSGFAGGHTLAADPESAIRAIEPDGQNVKWGKGKVSGWTAYQILVSLTRKKTTETFLQVTHEQYARRFGAAAGHSWKYCFTDEPTLRCAGGLYATPDFFDAFAAEHDYAFMDKLEDYLSFDPQRSWPVRFDYWSTANRLFTRNFCQTMYEWCDHHGLQLTGHFDEHQWPSPLSTPDAMAAQRWMQMPGIDLLGFQFNGDDISANSLYDLTIREVVSVARQLGRSRILCECYGGGGYGFTLDDAKALSIQLLGHGISFLNPHISMQSLAGSRKYDWAQTLSDHAPWWPFYRALADHDARASFLLSQSTPCAKVLVLHPTLSGWLHAVPRLFRESHGLKSEADALIKLREKHATFLTELSESGISFDLGDECILAELGKVEPGCLLVGEAAYDIIVVPDGMETIAESTCAILEDFAVSGGIVLALGTLPATVHGRPSARPQQWRGLPGWRACDTLSNLFAGIKARVTSTIEASSGLIAHERKMKNGRSMFVLANPGPSEVSTTVHVRSNHSLDVWDPASGNIRMLALAKDYAGHVMETVMPPRSLTFWMETDADAKFAAPRCPIRRKIELSAPAIRRCSDNVLPLSACSLTIDGHTHPWMQTAQANMLMWKQHGFPQDPWEWTIQYRREYVDRTFNTNSGYAVEYTFYIDPPATDVIRASAKLAIERPWLYQISVNGKTCSLAEGVRWFDENMRVIPVGIMLKPGHNTIRLAISPMNIHAEIAPVYVVGDFAVHDGQEQHILQQTAPLTMGGWTNQGLPFYPFSVRYSWNLHLPEPATALELTFNAWGGSAIQIEIDGKNVGAIIARPWKLEVDTHLDAGDHALVAEVYGNLANFLGPFFRKGLPIPWTWTEGPAEKSLLRDYPGLEHYGLIAPPVVRCV